MKSILMYIKITSLLKTKKGIQDQSLKSKIETYSMQIFK